MKRVTIPIRGEEMPLCFSLRVMKACGGRFGGLEGLDGALSGNGDAIQALFNCTWLLAQMLDAGYRYDKENGQDAVKPPDEDALLDTFGLDDLAELRASLMTAMTASNQRTVEAEPGKNAETTQEPRET